MSEHSDRGSSYRSGGSYGGGYGGYNHSGYRYQQNGSSGNHRGGPRYRSNYRQDGYYNNQDYNQQEGYGYTQPQLQPQSQPHNHNHNHNHHPPSHNAHGAHRQSYWRGSYHPYRHNDNRYNANHNYRRSPPSQQDMRTPTPTSATHQNSPYTGAEEFNKKFVIPKDESPFLYMIHSAGSRTTKLKEIYKENDEIDNKIEELKIKLFRDELELGLMSTQCEKDALNVQLTQEKLDSLLMN